MNPLQHAAVFLVETGFSLYILLLMLRFILQMVHADFYNPLSAFVVKLTNNPLLRLRKLIPSLCKIDSALVLLLFGFTFLKVTLNFGLMYHKIPSIHGLLILTVGDLTTLVIHIFFFAVLLRVMLSWISPMRYNPMLGILDYLTDPLLIPAKRYIPHIGGFDVSPIPVMVGLQLLSILIASPIIQFGLSLA